MSLNSLIVIKDFLGIQYALFILPDSFDCIMIGPFRYKNLQLINNKFSNYGFNEQVINNLEYYLNNTPIVDEELISVNLVSIVSTIYPSDKFEVKYIVENQPSNIIPKSVSLEKRQKDNTVIYYASIFKLDIDKTLQIAYKYTNNFEDAEFNKNFVIGPKSVKKSKGSFKNFEAGVAYFVRDLYRYPERYGSSIYEIRLDESPTIKQKNKNGKILMDNGLTFEQYVGHVSKLYDLDPAFVLSIINLESGYQSSYLFTNKNNVGGHRGIGGTWKSYTTLEAGVLAHVLSVKNIAEKNKIDALVNCYGFSKL
jgi:hypothetical protein